MSSPSVGISATMRGRELSTHTSGEKATSYWGIISLIATEAALFGSLIFGYYYLASTATARPARRRSVRNATTDNRSHPPARI